MKIIVIKNCQVVPAASNPNIKYTKTIFLLIDVIDVETGSQITNQSKSYLVTSNDVAPAVYARNPNASAINYTLLGDLKPNEAFDAVANLANQNLYDKNAQTLYNQILQTL